MPALTQEFRSTISGHVTDASGAAVPNAKISAVNIDNNETTTATTDGAGAYAIPFLRPGNYKLTATAPGFKLYTQDRLTLEAAKVTGIDIHLEVGAVTESVEVTATAVALDTQSATRSAVVTTQQVAEMPLNARNPFMLGAMMAGVTFNGAAIWQRPFDNGAIAQWSMNGGRDSSSRIHAGRRGQRRPDGRQQRRLCADRGRGAGIQRDGQHVRFAVRPHRRRHHERGAEERHQPVPRRRVTSTCAASRWTPIPSRTTPSASRRPTTTWISTASRSKDRCSFPSC